MLEVVTSWGAFGQPLEGSIAIAATPLPRTRRFGLHFSVPNPLRFGVKRAVLKRGSDAGGGVRGTVEAFSDDDSPSPDACRERCTCVRGYRRAMSAEVSCRSFAEFKADF